MAFEQLFSKAEGIIEGLPVAEGEDANLPCYFTPHFFAIENEDGLFISKEQLTLRQTIALLSENGYNYNTSKVQYSLDEIKPTVKVEAKAEEKEQPKKK